MSLAEALARELPVPGNGRCQLGQWLDAQTEEFRSEFKLFRDRSRDPNDPLSGMKLWKALRSEGFTGGITVFRMHTTQSCACGKADV